MAGKSMPRQQRTVGEYLRIIVQGIGKQDCIAAVRQIERLTGINRGIIQKAKVVNQNRPR